MLASVLVIALGVVIAFLTGPAAHQRVALPPTPPSPGTTSQGTSSGASSQAPIQPITCRRPTGTTGGDAPSRICIPTLRVDTTVMQLGLNSDRTVEVPPLSRVGDAGWYKYSAVPGTVGPTVILGHVDSAQFGNGVFFHLGQMHSGDTVVVARGDGKVATYRVNSVVQVPKKHFPTDDVYGATSGPAIRLVTCGGQFDAATGNYEDNIIAYGTLLNLS